MEDRQIQSLYEAHRAMIYLNLNPQNPRAAVANFGSRLVFLGGFNAVAAMAAAVKWERLSAVQLTFLDEKFSVILIYQLISAAVAVGVGLSLMNNPNPRHAQGLLVKVTWWAINLATICSLGLGVIFNMA